MTFKVKDGISVAGSTFVDGSRNTTTNNLTVGGNLTVSGTTTTINTATLEVADLNITVAKNATTAAAANGAGLTVAGASATLLYTSAADSWNFNKNVFASNLSGTNTGDNAGVTSVAAVTPIVSSGGTTPSISHATSGVGAGTYNNVTVNTFGHVTSGSNTAYLTTLTDTLATVTGRGATTTTAVILNGGLSTGSASTGVTRAVVDTGGNFLSYYAAETTARIQLGRDVGISGGAGLALGGALYALIASSDTNGSALYFKLNTAAATASTSPNMSLTSTGLSVAGTLTASNLSGTNTGDNAGVTAVAGVTPIVSSGGTTPSISHATSGATAGTYNNVTVNTFGHVTAGSNTAYLTAEADTLATVTARGNTTTTSIQASNLNPAYSVSNFDTIKAPGLYQYDGAMTSTPNGDANYRTIEIGGGGRYSQIALNYSSDGMWFRRQTDANWSTWRQVWHSGNLTNLNQLTNGPGYGTGTVTAVTATTPIVSSGGTTPNITHATSGATAGTYNNVTVNTFGHVTAGSNVGYVTSSGVTSVATSGGYGGLTLTGGTITTTGTITMGGTPTGTWPISVSGSSASVVATVAGTSSIELVRGNMGDNDQFRILVGATASNAGYVEIATADDGNEPIYVRQYTGVFGTLTRTATLLNESGNTSFPGTLTATNFSGSSSGTNTGDNPGVTSVAGVTPIVSSGGTTPSISHAASGATAGTYNNVTVNATGHVTAGSNVGYVSSSGVTSVATSGGYGGLTLTGGTITTTGTITMGGTPTGTWPISVSGNAATATNLSTGRTNWVTNGVGSAVVGMLGWKNYGNNHTIFDASASTAPDGSAISNSTPQNVWTGTYPTLMGWNGANTYGVRVDVARYADSAGSANETLATVTGRGASTSTRVTLSGGVTITSADIRSAATSTWTGDPGAEGKIQYHANRWYIVSDSSSDRIVQFRRNGGDVSYIDNSGNFIGNASTATTATTLQTSRTIDGTPFNGSANIDTTEWYHSDRNFPSGTLITTSINYAVTNGDPFVLEIRGNSYGNIIPLDMLYQGYIYADTIINHGGLSNGLNISGLVVLNVGGNLCFWFPDQGYWNGYNVKVYTAYATRATNRVTSITGTTKPAGTKEVALSANIRQSLHSGNYNSYSPTLTGTGASGTWGISITGTSNNITAYTINQNVGTGNQVTFDSIITSNNGSSNNVRLGDDCWIGDVNIADTFGLKGNQNNANGYIVFGNSNTTALGRAGTGALTYGGNTILHAGNYNSYSPTLTGGGASGTWGINITGNAVTASHSFGRTDSATYPVLWGVAGGTTQMYSCTAVNIQSSTGTLSASILTATSDIRVKTNIKKIDNALEKVLQLRGVTYDRTDIDVSRQTGVIAQEVLKVLPEAVTGSEETQYGVTYGNMVGLLIEAIKDQQIIIDSQESRIARLEALVFKLTEGK